MAASIFSQYRFSLITFNGDVSMVIYYYHFNITPNVPSFQKLKIIKIKMQEVREVTFFCLEEVRTECALGSCLSAPETEDLGSLCYGVIGTRKRRSPLPDIIILKQRGTEPNFSTKKRIQSQDSSSWQRIVFVGMKCTCHNAVTC